MTNQEFIESISLEGEIWKPVLGFEQSYLVSNKGRVASTKSHRRKGILLSLCVTSHGYHYVSLYQPTGERSYKGVHRLVAEAFIDNPNEYTQIDHINTIRTDNRVENLKWCTHSENSLNPITRKRNSQSHLNKKTHCQIPIVQLKNGVLVKIYNSIQLTKEDGFTPRCIHYCLKKEYKTHKGYTWITKSEYELLINKSKNESNPDTD